MLPLAVALSQCSLHDLPKDDWTLTDDSISAYKKKAEKTEDHAMALSIAQFYLKIHANLKAYEHLGVAHIYYPDQLAMNWLCAAKKWLNKDRLPDGSSNDEALQASRPLALHIDLEAIFCSF